MPTNALGLGKRH